MCLYSFRRKRGQQVRIPYLVHGPVSSFVDSVLEEYPNGIFEKTEFGEGLHLFLETTEGKKLKFSSSIKDFVNYVVRQACPPSPLVPVRVAITSVSDET